MIKRQLPRNWFIDNSEIIKSIEAVLGERQIRITKNGVIMIKGSATVPQLRDIKTDLMSKAEIITEL